MGQADLLRRAMGKKKIKIMKQEEPKFKKGVMDKGHSDAVANELWEYLLPFADYGFNKAHGAGYAVVAYWCAYLKAHYPIEFLAGLLHSDIHDSDRIVVDMNEAKSMGIEILPPDINHSEKYFTIEGTKTVRFGLGAIKNTSEKAIEEIVRERKENGEFTSLDNLVERVGTAAINKKTLECLIKVGSMDAWGERNALLTVMPAIWDRFSRLDAIKVNGQSDLFGMIQNESGTSFANEITALPTVKEAGDLERINWEKELIGTYVTDHPLTSMHKHLLSSEFKTISRAKLMQENSSVEILCIISNIKSITTKSGKPMAFLKIEDLDDNAEGVIFNRTYLKLRESLSEFAPVIIKGKTNFRDDRFSILVDDVVEPDDRSSDSAIDKILIDIRGEKDKEKLGRIRNAVTSSPGDTELEIIYGSEITPKSLIKKVEPTRELLTLITGYKR
jgi:DNA polymerase-3 subunit alpha